MTTHRALLEATNAGHYFADCTCGWSGGVHRSRPIAKAAWQAHMDDDAPVESVKTVVMLPLDTPGDML